MTDLLTTSEWIEINITVLPSWSDMVITNIGLYKIYICVDSLEESIADPVTSIKKPAVTSDSDVPTTEIIKLNRLDRLITIKGKISTQTATLAGVDTLIDSTFAKNVLIDLFRMYNQPVLHWDGFKDSTSNVVVQKMTFGKTSQYKDNNPSDVFYSFNANLIVGNRMDI